MAEAFGWKAWHVAAPMRGNRTGGFVPDPRATGLPDLFLLHDDPPRMIIAELKGTGGQVSDRQREFLTLARDVAEMTVGQHNHHPEEMAVVGGAVLHRIPVHTSTGACLGVYCWYPEDEPIVEQILRSKVLA